MNAAASFVLSYALNALWQAPLVVGVAWIATRMVQGRSLVLEHRIWSAALPLCVLLPVCDASVLGGLSSARKWLLHLVSGAAPKGTVTVAIGPAIGVAAHPSVVPPLVWVALATAVVLMVLLLTARLGWGMLRTQSLVLSAADAVLTKEQEQVWQRNLRRFGIAHARLAVSGEVFGPVTIGILRPAVLVPEGWLESCSMDDLEAALAHECAHIWRHDFARNLAFEVGALPIAWHPVVVVLRARFAESREMLCDALAAEAVGGTALYARSLVRLASQLANDGPAKTLHAIGMFDAATFERRIMQLTHHSLELRGLRRMVVLSGCSALAFGACASAFALHVDGPSVSASVAPQTKPVAMSAAAEKPVAAITVAPAPLPNPTPAVREVATPAPVLKATPVQGPAPLPPPPPPPPPQTATQAMRISAGVATQMVVYQKPPVYPEIARVALVEGAVVLHVLIGEDGAPMQIAAVSGPEMLKGAALEAVKEWRWRPYLLNGQPTAVDTTVTVTFSLAE